MQAIFTKNLTAENSIHAWRNVIHGWKNVIHGWRNVICGCHPWMERWHPWMEKCHPWMEKCHPWMSSMDGEMSSMDGSVIRGCHPWMTSMDEDNGWRTRTQPMYLQAILKFQRHSSLRLLTCHGLPVPVRPYLFGFFFCFPMLTLHPLICCRNL